MFYKVCRLTKRSVAYAVTNGWSASCMCSMDCELAPCEQDTAPEYVSSRASNRPPDCPSDSLPNRSPNRSSNPLQISPQILAQPTPQAVLRPPSKLRPQGPKMLLESEPVIETLDKKFGHNVATRMSRKRPKVVAWFLQICKEMLHGGASRAGGSGRFLDTGLATFWPNLN